MQIPEISWTHFNRRYVYTGSWSRISDIMFCCANQMALRNIVFSYFRITLHTYYKSFTHFSNKVWVFSKTFFNSPIPWISCKVKQRSKELITSC